MRRIAQEHDVHVTPAFVADGREDSPDRAVLHELVSVELLREDPLAESLGLVLAGAGQTGRSPRFLPRLDDAGRVLGVVLVSVVRLAK